MKRTIIFPRKIGLQLFLNIFVIGLLLVALTATILFPVSFIWKAALQQTESFCMKIVDQTRDGLITTIKNMDSRLISLSKSRTVYDGICRGELDKASPMDFRSAFLDFFPIDGMDYHYIQSVDLYVKKTGQLFRIGDCPQIQSDPFSSLNPYHKAALSNPLILNWTGYNKELGALEIAKLIYDTQTYEELGLMIVRLLPTFFLEEFKNFDGLDIRNMYLLDQSQRILCSLDTAQIDQKMDIVLNEEISRQGDMTYISRDFSSLSLSRYAEPYSQWHIVIELDAASLYSEMYAVLFHTAIASLAILALGILAALIFSRNVTRPILAVAEGFKYVEREDYTNQIKDKSIIVETNTIINSYNHMLAHLNQLINTIYREKIAADELRFKSLQATINPHFLFNTLQLISWKARAYRANDVCSMIKSLSFMLEASLACDASPFVTLGQEMEYLKHYVYIIRCKYEDKIDFQIDIPEEYQDKRIPRLTLQPIIENAVSHGIAPKMGNGSIAVQAQEQNGMLCLRIQDDGVGMSPEQLQIIREGLLDGESDHQPAPRQSTHNIALRNICHRLRLLYRDQFTFTVESQQFSGTTIVVNIPCGGEEERHV